MSVQVIESVAAMRAARKNLGAKSLGLVPTLGGLHAGHASLIERALQENDAVAVSVFLNPTQFDRKEDFEKYPASLSADLSFLEKLGVAIAFLPSAQEIYADHYTYKVTETELSRRFCGAFRPGHFDGVLTVVMKLLMASTPTRAYFGEKDFQQLELVRGMVKALFIPVEIVGCPTIRDERGLALSSRNARLSEAGRVRAAEFPAILRSSATAEAARAPLTARGFQVDYVEDDQQKRLAAVWLEGVRLIDHVGI